MINEILRQAVDAIKSGEKEAGKELLIKILEQDDSNEAAWLWMTRCVTDRDVKRDCFERVLEINPNNEHAIRGLKLLNTLSKVRTSTSPKRKKVAKEQNRLIIGIAVGALVGVMVLVGIWQAMNNRSTQSEPVATIAVLIPQVPTTAIATSTSAPSPTSIVAWTTAPTRTPLLTNTPRLTSTPRSTNTPRPTPIPMKTPVPLGHTAQVYDPNFSTETAITVLEVRRGEAVQSLFETWCWNDLHEQQEVVAVRVKIDYLSGPANEMRIFSYLDFLAAYPDETTLDSFGMFCWSNPDSNLFLETYPPGAGDGWLAWEIRKGSELPHLLYQFGIVIVELGPLLDPVVFLLE